jgi:WD40 repeat protein
VDRIDVSPDGDFLASTDFEVVRFWNISYLKSIKVSDREKGDNKKAFAKNLPSSRLQDARNFFADLDE